MSDTSESHSSDSSIMNEKVELAKTIAQKGMDSSSILECLEQKVAQLLQSKEETIDLKAKYKMLQETAKLQEAEFSFQQSENEKEISRLKTIEKELRATISKLQGGKVDLNHQYDIQVGLESKSNSVFQAKYQKWKEKAHSLSCQLKSNSQKQTVLDQDSTIQEELQNTREELKDVQSRNQELQEKVKALTIQLEDGKNSLKTMRGDFTDVHSQQKLEFEKLQKDRDQLADQLEKARQKIQKQKSKLEGSNHSESSSNPTLIEQENQKLHSKIKSLKDKLKQIQKIDTELQTVRNQLEQDEIEKENIAELFNVDPDTDWSEITLQAHELINQLAKQNEISLQNEKLKKRLAAALEDARKLSLNSNKSSVAYDDDYVETLRQNLKETRSQLEVQSALLSQLQCKNSFALPIEKINSHLMNQITDTYSAIIKERNSMRPLLLAVIFTHRFLNLAKCDGSNISALLAFGGRSSYSPEHMITKIRERFSALTQDLVVTKQNLLELTQKYHSLVDEHDDISIEMRSRADEVKLIRKKFHCLKQRMTELQDELSHLVSPEVYNEVCERVKELEKINVQLNKTIKQQQAEIEKRTLTARHLSEKMEQVSLTANQKEEEAQASQLRFEEKQQEVETLQSIIREKTKEILALERIVHRHREKETTNAAAFTCLAVENQKPQNCGFEPKISTAPLTQTVTIANGINPAFLGQ